MSGPDLTRWNRAGLGRFRYVDGNAVTYLERLRERLAESYTGPGETLPRWSELVTRHPVPAQESAAAREARLLAQYADTRRDHGWEILRAFARSTHVLTEHLDAFANETFIGTATQWESIAKLVALLDARPAPPASARTDLALIAKATGRLVAGFQVKNAPKDGGAPAIFETIADLDVDPALNALRPTDWDRSQETLSYVAWNPAVLPLPDATRASGHVAQFPLAVTDAPPTVGKIAVLEVLAEGASALSEGVGVEIAKVQAGAAILLGQAPSGGGALNPKRWRLRLHAGAELVQTPRLAGPDVVILTPEHALSPGRSTVTWYASGWKSAKVLEVDGDRVRLAGAAMPPDGASLYRMVAASRQNVGGTDRVVVPTDRGGGAKVWSPELSDFSASLASEPAVGAFVSYQYVTAMDALLYVPAGSDPVAQVIETAPLGLVLGGAVKGLEQGDWIVSAGDQLKAVRVDAVIERDGDTVVETTPEISDLRAPLHLLFSRELRPFEYDRNRTLAFDTANRSDRVTRLLLETGAGLAALKRGRQVIFETNGLAHSASVTAVDATSGWAEVAPPVPGTELTEPQSAPPLERWNTAVYANVVTADHGETQPRKILGSGDATQSGQSFEVSVDKLSFVTDPLMPSGVRAAIEVEVGDRRWRQVGNLRDSGPAEADYEVRLADDQSVSIRFGDGRTGRRLPTGTDNIRYRWRKGVGADGNLAAGELKKIVKPDPLVDRVSQPLAAAGGAATESLGSVRETAASGLLTLGRAVSVEDFGTLAARNAQVLQAVSFSATEGAARGERVRVVVVPAGGRMGTLGDDLQTFLQNNALPGVQIEVAAYVPLPLSLRAVLRIDTAAYDPDKVAASVRAAIEAAYGLARARLGAPLFRSQLLALIESVEGVENATAEIDVTGWIAVAPPPLVNRSPGGAVRNVKPRRDQMIHIDPAQSNIAIRTETYTL